MIKIKFWNKDADESWEREFKKPNYILRTSWSLRELDYKILKDNIKNPNYTFQARIERFKSLVVENQPCCLNDESLEACLILGAKPQIGLNINTIPGYLKEDPTVIDDLIKNIEEELCDCFQDQESIENFYNTMSVDFKPLKNFPKTIQNEPLYYYTPTTIEAGLITSIMPELDYWSDFDLNYKVVIDGEEFFVHLKHNCGQCDLARVYSYETKKPINSKINEDIIIELLIFNIWKMYSKI